MSQKYAALSHTTSNIGDTIQTLAATRFLPRIDAYVSREKADKFHAGQKHKLILNGWWLHRPRHFPPSGDIEPLLISMHLDPAQEARLFSGKALGYLREHGPVGCRDLVSLRLCEKHNVPAYFSGCLTTTLVRNPRIKRDNFILAVDVPQHVLDEVRARASLPVLSIEKDIYTVFDVGERMQIAKVVLSLYHKAHCVISPNLHTALPCVAIGTPVLNLIPGEGEFLRKRHGNLSGRLSGLDGLFNSASEAGFLDDKRCYDFDCPPANPSGHLAMREGLAKTASEFTGFNNEESLIGEGFESAVSLLRIMSARQSNERPIAKGAFKDLLRKASRAVTEKFVAALEAHHVSIPRHGHTR